MAPGETGETTGAVAEQPVEATGEFVQATGAVTQQPVGETGETVQAPEAVTKKPLYDFLPKFTSERWSEGIYDAEHNIMSPSLNISEEDLLTFNERVELETRSLVFQYQLRYSEKEYELMRKEFQKIEEKAKQKASEAKPGEHVFAVPDVPQLRKDRTNTGSETEDKSTAYKKPKKTRKPKKAGSETEGKESADESSSNKPAEVASRRLTRGSSSGTDKELTSSTEEQATQVPGKAKRGKKIGN